MIKKNAPILDKDTQNHFSLSFICTFFLIHVKWENNSIKLKRGSTYQIETPFQSLTLSKLPKFIGLKIAAGSPSPIHYPWKSLPDWIERNEKWLDLKDDGQKSLWREEYEKVPNVWVWMFDCFMNVFHLTKFTLHSIPSKSLHFWIKIEIL